MFKPSTFPGQKPDEKIHLFLRRHWLSFLPAMLSTFVMLLIPIFIFIGFKSFGILLGEFKNLAILGTSCYLLFVLAFFTASFIDYYLDISIVTDHRIIDIDQRGLFNRAVSEQSLIRVQDATAKKRGILQTFFRYGDVFIQTAGEAPNFEFECVPKPYEAAQKIMGLHHDVLAKGYREPEEKPPVSPGASQGGPPKPNEPLAEPKQNPEEDLKEIPKLDQ